MCYPSNELLHMLNFKVVEESVAVRLAKADNFYLKKRDTKNVQPSSDLNQAASAYTFAFYCDRDPSVSSSSFLNLKTLPTVNGVFFY
jgi:hypothetical protein